ncbi:hypothetical protein B0E46_12515 [Rhodanobacter sp. B04]|uniref:hypothetical protein n=1 Tax=Rhodanobacter sp. B04 TaxID=1945860 RepID=UPI000985D0B1|nr:hypothetical protein [Rhodanobacter sp. B04]OOG62463.1 hypothetical protein B0E46_12515 [Rhodanobacter sp. B04]
MDHICARRLQDEFKPPPVLAQEIAAEQTPRALLHRWQPRAWLLCWLLLPVLAGWVDWLPSYRQLIHGGMFAALVVTAMMGRVCIARWLAGAAMLAAAMARARRLGAETKEKADA